MRIALYIIFGISLFLPFYTYVLYPIFLKLFRDKHYKSESVKFGITAIICFGESDDSKKIESLERFDYPIIQTIANRNITEAVNQATGEILVFLDNATELDEYAIANIVKPFSDERVEMVVGEQTCRDGNSVFWKYETKIKRLESRIGCVSGANNTLFAVRKEKMPTVPSRIKNAPFYVSTKIKQNKGDVVYCPDSKTYETKQEGTNFKKHIIDASGYWQAFVVFWKMLFPRNGFFVYISHRVMKWFVPFNLIFALVSNAWLSLYSIPFQIILLIHLLCYAIAIMGLFLKKTPFKILSYFLVNSFSFLIGIFKR